MQLTLILWFVAMFCSTGCWQTAAGEKMGQVIKVSQKGNFVTTWEASIIRGSLQDGSGALKQFNFTIEDRPDLVEKLQFALKNNRDVRVRYHKELLAWDRSPSHGNFADDIEIIGTDGPLAKPPPCCRANK